MYVLKRDNEDNDGRAGDAYEEEDFEQTHAEESEMHGEECNADARAKEIGGVTE